TARRRRVPHQDPGTEPVPARPVRLGRLPERGDPVSGATAGRRRHEILDPAHGAPRYRRRGLVQQEPAAGRDADRVPVRGLRLRARARHGRPGAEGDALSGGDGDAVRPRLHLQRHAAHLYGHHRGISRGDLRRGQAAPALHRRRNDQRAGGGGPPQLAALTRPRLDDAARERMLAHDRLGDRFDDVINEYDVARRLEVLVDEFLGPCDLRGLKALAAGCGTGRATERLVRRGARVTALDFGSRLVDFTKRRCACAPAVGSILQLPFTDAAFDVVLSTEVIEHVPDPEAAVREVARVLVRGGHLVLSTPNRLWQTPVRLASAIGARPYDGLENFLRPSRLRRVVEDAGLRVVEHRGIHIL